ncbi:hypothetical protein [Cystobacter ferrugineus]|uniref:Uncharacterized protein n=1 Tax=Cystobacter ferrugineus TaxID=83449 RepID=A0A1L9BJP7_9BACT|nr:hypothetical protein [Cystobacter ferrugineus]OJH42467.1 hypothetical protein BON30_04540 [Cystobacter ferrugineus]
MNAVELARAACLILIVALMVVGVLRRKRWVAWLRDMEDVFAQHGVTLEDHDKFRWVAKPIEDASEVELEGLVEEALPPGADPERVSGVSISRLKVPLTGGGLLMVPPDLVEPLLGPLPPVPRVRTGEARFDAAFSCFAQGGEPPRWPNGAAFPSPGDLAFLQAHRMRWLRWNEDLLEVAFEPRAPADAVPLLAFAQALRRGQQGRAVSTPPAAAPSMPVAPVAGFGMEDVAWFILPLGGVMMFSAFAPRLFGPLNDVVSLHVCGVEGLQFGNEWALCPDGREVSGAALLAGAWIGWLPVLALRLLHNLSRLVSSSERPTA